MDINDDGATHNLPDVVGSLHRSLTKAERILNEEATEAGYSITHFEIEFPAQLQIRPDVVPKGKPDRDAGDDSKRKHLPSSSAKDLTFVTLPRTRKLMTQSPEARNEASQSEAEEQPQHTIPEQNLSRLKIVLRKQIDLHGGTIGE